MPIRTTVSIALQVQARFFLFCIFGENLLLTFFVFFLMGMLRHTVPGTRNLACVPGGRERWEKKTEELECRFFGAALYEK